MTLHYNTSHLVPARHTAKPATNSGVANGILTADFNSLLPFTDLQTIPAKQKQNQIVCSACWLGLQFG